MGNKLNVLFICNKSPWPPREGGPIAMNNIIEGVTADGNNVKVLAINTNKYNFDPDTIPKGYKLKTGIELAYIDLGIKPVDAFLNLFTSESYHVKRFISSNFEDKLTEVLKSSNFDIVQIETLFMSPYIPVIRKFSSAKIVLRAHNIEHLIWKRIGDITGNPLKKWYLRHLSSTLEKYERDILNSYDGIVPISFKDEDFFRRNCKRPVKTISFGVNTEKYKMEQDQESEHALFHIGAMNWIPNEEGIKWFLDEVWPEVNNTLPKLKLYLAGREMPQWLENLRLSNVVVMGEVPDAQEFIKSKTISIAPLLSGSGIRIKLIESMALGKAVISTSIGAEGINYSDGKDIKIADTAKETIQAITQLYQDPEKTNEIGKNARKLILKDHNNELLTQQLIGFYRELI